MKRIKVLCVLVFMAFSVVVLFGGKWFVPVVSSFSSGPPAGFTGGPGESSCTACHENIAGPGQFIINAPATYIPGQTYQITVQHASADATRLRWGFQMTSLDGSDVAAGSFSEPGRFTQIISQDGRNYVEQNLEGSYAGQPTGAQWTFNWTAPQTGAGTVFFYAAGNQANNDGSPNGDRIFTAVGLSQQAETPPQYQIFDIGVAQMGDTASQGFGVSKGGTAVGRSFRTGGTQAFSWSQGTGLVGLPNLAGRAFAVSNAANDNGIVVGTGATTAFGSGRLPIVWDSGFVSQLPLPAGETLGDANDVNSSGVTVGSVDAGSTQQAAIYNGGTATVITQTAPGGSFFTTAFGINDSNRIAGIGIDPNNAARNVGMVYDIGSSSAIDIGALSGANGALAFGISNAGHVTGSSMMNQGSGLPFIWFDGQGMFAIPLPDGTSQGSGRAVNSTGWVVGNASSAFSVPFLYTGSATYRLQDIIPAGSGWDLSMNTSSSALGISDNGIIVGTGVHNGETHAYAMVPVGLPSPTPTPTPTVSPTPTPTVTPTPFPEFDLTISQTDSPNPVTNRQPLTYTLTVSIIPTALGGSASPQVRFNFPSGVPIVFNSTGVTNGYVATPDANGVSFAGGVISTSGTSAGTATLTVVVTPQAVGTLTSAGANVVVDPNNLISESNESNNTAQTAVTAVRAVAFDYDADGRSDISVFRPSAGAWYLQQSTAGLAGYGFGDATDRIVPADYDGDGKTDVAVYRPSNGFWYIINSSNGTVSFIPYGLAEDLPAPGDFDGDGKADLSVFRPSTGTFHRINSSNGSSNAVQFGQSGDSPVVGDFDSDGKSDIAVYRPSNGGWFRLNSFDGSFAGVQFGAPGDVMVPADYDGDGHTDTAVWRPSNGFWYIIQSSNGSITYTGFGLPADIPAAGDFDGDGKADISVFRPSDGAWYRTNSSTGGFVAFPFGASGDRPTQGAFNNSP